ncbi:MAG: efflux RND transporter periplasmic adaptor subunit [Bacteroidota bacterium]
MNKLAIIIPFIFFAACQHSETRTAETSAAEAKTAEPGTPEARGCGSHGRMEHRRMRIRGGQRPVESNSLFARGDTVFVPANSNVNAKLKMEAIRSQEHLMQVTTTGVVKPLSGHLAEIAVPFEGRIVKSFVKLGQKVSTGTPLFEVSSSDYLESVRMCLQAGRERELAEKNFIRKKDLLESGISSRKEFDEAKLALELAEKECEKTNAILKIYNLNSEEADLSQALIVRSPISGEIVHSTITVGQYIKSDSDPIVTIADLEKVWVIARVKEKDLGAIHPQDQVEVFTEGLPDKAIEGVVDYIGNIMNEQTRSVDVYIECENPGKILKSGMFVTARFYHKLTNAIIVPASAVLQDYDTSYLFVQAGPEIFVKRKVEVTSVANEKLMVRSGLENGSIIVTEGGIYLR